MPPEGAGLTISVQGPGGSIPDIAFSGLDLSSAAAAGLDYETWAQIVAPLGYGPYANYQPGNPFAGTGFGPPAVQPGPARPEPVVPSNQGGRGILEPPPSPQPYVPYVPRAPIPVFQPFGPPASSGSTFPPFVIQPFAPAPELPGVTVQPANPPYIEYPRSQPLAPQLPSEYQRPPSSQIGGLELDLSRGVVDPPLAPSIDEALGRGEFAPQASAAPAAGTATAAKEPVAQTCSACDTAADGEETEVMPVELVISLTNHQKAADVIKYCEELGGCEVV
jgi:hypothetical protein